MTTLLRASMALFSFALGSALYGSDFDVDIASGQQLSFQIAGNAGTEIWVTKLGAGGGLAAYLYAIPDGSGWTFNYFWYPTIYQSGVTFVANPYIPYDSFYQGSFFGLSPGTYRITLQGAGNIPEYYRSQNGSTYYSYQGDYATGNWVDHSFEVY